jgi:hypothetical protein
MPQFEIVHSRYRGSPTIELLKDGEPFWEDIPGAKKHFRFGVNKAILILACIKTIKEFNDSGGRRPTAKETRVHSKEWCIQCDLRRHKGFNKRGTWYDSPYLEIRAADSIAFGQLKARAIVQHEKNIKRFVLENYKRRIT